MRLIVTRFFILFVVLVSLLGCGRDAKIKTLTQQGIEAFQKKDYDTAIACWNSVLQLDPTNSNAREFRGGCYFAKREFDKALSDYNECLRVNPNNSRVLGNRGSIYFWKTNDVDALADYDESIRLNPASADAFGNRGMLYDRETRLTEAIQDYSEAIRLETKNIHIYLFRGFAFAREGEVAKALDDFANAIELDPKNYEIYNKRAWLLATCADASLRDGGEAVQAAQKACQLSDWKNWGCLDTLAAAYAEAGDFENAITAQKKAMGFEPVAANEKAEMQQRLELYQQNLPYHKMPKP